ncbi:hypothetical protein D3C87_2059700 [compost metagenome]
MTPEQLGDEDGERRLAGSLFADEQQRLGVGSVGAGFAYEGKRALDDVGSTDRPGIAEGYGF